MSNINSLKARFDEARYEAGVLMKRHRNIKNGYANGVTGVE